LDFKPRHDFHCRSDRRGDRVGAVMKLQIIEAPGQFQQ
jgi:hypothetical protein